MKQTIPAPKYYNDLPYDSRSVSAAPSDFQPIRCLHCVHYYMMKVEFGFDYLDRPLMEVLEPNTADNNRLNSQAAESAGRPY